ncbi:MAG: hypothetical protein QN141_00770 [Armatimonadota bacterium]|nr:hypothetical protein [Armatimonadota bacterium]MDR7450869.1 hypothetical protein [Armatimonadota bacterium]MDR7465791.1 hypothetical protein [Armatimonadota bacterium]MDR7493699.1 hypothetical protein [Armatimonadota bacterium]MDR7499053.1 hypothetical protein [Armatimonadota bacterium]
MPARTYAQWGGAALVALGIGGLFAGRMLLVLNAEFPIDALRLLVGGTLVWAGRAGRGQARGWAAVAGVIFAATGLTGLFTRDFYGLLDYGVNPFDNVLHLLLGMLGLWAGWRPPSA